MVTKPKGKPRGAERDFAASEVYAGAMDKIAKGENPFPPPKTTVFQASLPRLRYKVVRVRDGSTVQIAETHGRIDEKAARETLANLKKLVGFEPPEE